MLGDQLLAFLHGMHTASDRLLLRYNKRELQR